MDSKLKRKEGDERVSEEEKLEKKIETVEERMRAESRRTKK